MFKLTYKTRGGLSNPKKYNCCWCLNFFFFFNWPKYYIRFSLWRLTNRSTQSVSWGMKGLKTYFTFLCCNMSRFAESKRRRRKRMRTRRNDFFSVWQLNSTLVSRNRFVLTINAGTDNQKYLQVNIYTVKPCVQNIKNTAAAKVTNNMASAEQLEPGRENGTENNVNFVVRLGTTASD